VICLVLPISVHARLLAWRETFSPSPSCLDSLGPQVWKGACVICSGFGEYQVFTYYGTCCLGMEIMCDHVAGRFAI
jgi:hypothetical protein